MRGSAVIGGLVASSVLVVVILTFINTNLALFSLTQVKLHMIDRYITVHHKLSAAGLHPDVLEQLTQNTAWCCLIPLNRAVGHVAVSCL